MPKPIDLSFGRDHNYNMKKTLLFLCLFPIIVSASGKLSLGSNYFTEHRKILPAVGVGIYEPIVLGLYYDSYTGVGVSPRFCASDVSWIVSRHDIGKNFGDLGITVGVTARLSEQGFVGSEDESNVHVRASYKLW